MTTTIKKSNGKYILKRPDMASRLISLVMLAIIIASAYFLIFTAEYRWEAFNPRAFKYFMTEFLRFDKLAFGEITEAFSLLGNTIALAFLTTFIGIVLGFVLGLLASINVTNVIIASIIKSIAGLVRSIPTIIWVIFFISGYGLTATTAIVGMSFHSISFFVKSFSEAFEEVDKGTIETLKATGATKLQIIFSAMVPSAYSKLLAWMAVRFEINFAVAVIIGPAVGVVGTIGTRMNTYSRAANYPGLGLTIVAVFIVAFILEILATKFKQKSQ